MEADVAHEDRPTTFEGTPVEVEALVREFFEHQRVYLSNSTEEDAREGVLDAFDRTVWKVSLTPCDAVAPGRVRDTLAKSVARLDREREIYALVGEPYANERPA